MWKSTGNAVILCKNQWNSIIISLEAVKNRKPIESIKKEAKYEEMVENKWNQSMKSSYGKIEANQPAIQ